MRSFELGTPGELRDRLNALVLSGTKVATTGLLDVYVKEMEGLEFVGERLALLGSEGEFVATLEVTGVEVKPFIDVTWEHAAAEGEGDTSLEDWRAGHRRYFARTGTPVEDHTSVTCLRFRLVEDPTAPSQSHASS
ncbi:ASCH domain-containing protein [Streptomyces sp. NPDC002104]